MPHLTLGNETIYHEVHGSGDPLLLLHGGFCSLETMRPLGDLLGSRFTVHAPERAGHGRTADRNGPASYARMLTETVDYLDAVGMDAVHVVGHSDGGILALLLALEHPDRVRSLIPISANLHPDAFVPDDYPHVTMPEEAGRLLSNQYAELSPDGADHAPVVLEKLMTMWRSQPDIAEDALRSLDIPALVMAGEHDSIRRSHTTAIARAIPGAQLLFVPASTHMLVSEDPAEIAAAILRFLAPGSDAATGEDAP